jgi:hypothetical protein
MPHHTYIYIYIYILILSQANKKSGPGKSPRYSNLTTLGDLCKSWNLFLCNIVNCYLNSYFLSLDIITCRMVRVTKIMGSGSDDWIY